MLCCITKTPFSLHQWRIIAGGTKCIPKSELPLEDDDPQSQPAAPPSSRLWLHPSDLSIALSASTPLYPPGRIIHVVHNHPPPVQTLSFHGTVLSPVFDEPLCFFSLTISHIFVFQLVLSSWFVFLCGQKDDSICKCRAVMVMQGLSQA